MSRIHLSRCLWIMIFAALLPVMSMVYATDGQDESAGQLVPAKSFSGAYLAGRIASSNNDIPTAIDYFRQALTFSPGNSLIEQDLLLLLLSNDKFDEALPFARTLADEQDIERFSRLALAVEAFREDDFDQVATLLDLDDPDMIDHLVAGLMGAWSLFGQGKQEAAIRLLDELEGPVWYDLFRYYHLALMYGLVGDGSRAETAFEKALDDQDGGASAPDSYERILAAFAAFRQRQGEEAKAIELLRQGSEALIGRNVLKIMESRIEKGETLDSSITDAQSGAAEVLYSIGTAVNRPGSEIYSRLYLNMALALRPDHDATLFQLADLGIRMGQPQDSMIFYQRLTPSSPYFRDGQLRLGLTLADMGQEEEAATLLRARLESEPEDEKMLVALSSLYMKNKAFNDVVTVVDAYLEQIDVPQKEQWSLFFQRGIAYERLQQWPQAEADFRQALAFSPEQPQLLNYLGYSLIDRDMKLGEALDMVRRAAELRPKDGAIIDSLGWAYYKLGHYEAAIEALEEAVGLQPEDPTINDHLGDAYWQTGRRFEAVFQWNHAIAGQPEAEELAKIEEKIKNGLSEEAASQVVGQ